ncbi:hypothetical protein ACSQ67_020732 [Phaseolus vulgaris]
MILLFGTTQSVVLESDENHIKSATFLSESFEVGQGKVAVKTLFDIDFPKGHIGVKSFDVEVVDEDGNSVPLYETYLHHWFAVKYIENITMSHYIKQSHDVSNGIEYERNDGACQGFLLPHHWGLGGESRGTSSNLPNPFAVELADRVRSNGSTPVHDCRVEYTIPRIHDSDSLHVKKANIPMTKGGYLIYGTCSYAHRCCQCYSIWTESDENHIKSATFLSESFEVGQGKVAVKTLFDIDFPKGHIGVKSFDVEVVDEDGNSVPLYETYLHHWFAVKYIENITMSHYIKQSHDVSNGIEYERNDGACQGFLLPHHWGLGGESRGTSSNLPNPFAVELADRVRSNGSTPVEYTIPRIHDSDSLHVKKANIPMTKGGYLIYGTRSYAHRCCQCYSIWTGKEAGNEKGYLVGMSVCYPKPGSIKIKDGEILTVESRYENKFRIGAMGHFYIYLAEQIPNKDLNI